MADIKHLKLTPEQRKKLLERAAERSRALGDAVDDAGDKQKDAELRRRLDELAAKEQKPADEGLERNWDVIKARLAALEGQGNRTAEHDKVVPLGQPKRKHWPFVAVGGLAAAAAAVFIVMRQPEPSVMDGTGRIKGTGNAAGTIVCEIEPRDAAGALQSLPDGLAYGAKAGSEIVFATRCDGNVYLQVKALAESGATLAEHRNLHIEPGEKMILADQSGAPVAIQFPAGARALKISLVATPEPLADGSGLEASTVLWSDDLTIKAQ